MKKLRKRLGYSENDAKQATKPAYDKFNKCAQNDCNADTSEDSKNDFNWRID